MGITILISYRAYFKVRKVIEDKEGYYIMIKKSIFQENRIFSVYIPKNSIKICKAETKRTVRGNR